jgi:hypothetical protein
MSIKQQAIEYLNTKLSDDEPVFVLRAQDKFAPELLLDWCRLVEEHHGGVETPKTRDARRTALEMFHWPFRKVPD